MFKKNQTHEAAIKGYLPGEIEEHYKVNRETAERLLREPDRLDEALCKIEEKLQELPKVGHILAMIPALAMMVRSYARREYMEVPAGTIVSIVAVLLYFLTPIDVVPDAIPELGLADDALLLMFCLDQVKDDINLYKEWRKKTHGSRADNPGISGEPQYVKATILN